MEILRGLNLYKEYKMGDSVSCVLNDVSLRVNEGEYLAICGASGSGKSTLLNILGLIDLPTKGKVFWEGRDVSDYPDNRRTCLRNQKIGYVFQSFYLEPHYTSYQNVEMPLIIAGIPKKERKERIEKALETVGLSDRMKNKAGTLSGGEQQRVCIARALVNQPSVILADEPCGNLDSDNTESVLELFDRLHEEGKTIIMVTHSREDALRAERIISMRDGKIIQ